MPIKVSSRTNADIDSVVKEIDQRDVRVVIYFFSVDLERIKPHEKFKRAFPRAVCIGASMIGGWSSSNALETGITAMSLSSEEVDETFVSFREGVKKDPKGAAREVIEDLKRKIGRRQVNPEDYLGIVLFDGLCLGEEVIRELTVEDGFVFPIIGGAAADQLDFKTTFIACDDRLSGDGVLVLVMKMRIPFYYNHYVHYVPTGHSFVVTRAEPSRRIVWEIDGQPAAPYYARLLGLKDAAELRHGHFARNPLGVVIGDTVYARSPNAVMEGTGLQFYCYIEAGTRVSMLKQGDILDNARKALEEARDYVPNLQGAILFNCVLRYLEMKELNKLKDFNDVFKPLDFIGFNTYGEELFTHHNQTLTAVFFGR